MRITLSSQTQKVINFLHPDLSVDNDQINLDKIIHVFESQQANIKRSQYNHKQRIKLLTGLLQDIKLHCINTFKPKNARSIHSNKEDTKLGFLISMAALIIIGCESFDGIASILGLFALNPLITLVIACGVCLGAILLNKLLKIIGSQAHYLEQQLTLIDEITICLEDMLDQSDNPNLTDINEVLQSLQKAQQLVEAEMEYLRMTKKHLARKVVQCAITGFLACIVFCGGFFTGQTVAFFVAGLFAATTVTAWPVLIPALCVGLVVACIYMIEEYPTIKNAMRHWFGFAVEPSEDPVNQKQVSQKLSVLELRMHREKQRLDQAARIGVLEQELASFRVNTGQNVMQNRQDRTNNIQSSIVPITTVQTLASNRSSPLSHGGMYAVSSAQQSQNSIGSNQNINQKGQILEETNSHCAF